VKRGIVAQPHQVRACRVCDCTGARACLSGRYWVAEDLCNACAAKNPALLDPSYWLHETSSVLRPAIERYPRREVLSPEDIAALRA